MQFLRKRFHTTHRECPALLYARIKCLTSTQLPQWVLNQIIKGHSLNKQGSSSRTVTAALNMKGFNYLHLLCDYVCENYPEIDRRQN